MPNPRLALAVILLLYGVMASIGITWGLPSARIDKYLFGGDAPWPGEKIARLARASEKASDSRGADVDADPLDLSSNGPIHMTATEADVAAIYLRYRLYTHQPDEMITMMALAGMKPRQFQFDPRLYQYGGLFIYPVGAAIGLAGALGLVHVTSDLTYYLDHPDEFGKFYVIARAYVAAWGAAGVVLVYAIARRIQISDFRFQRSKSTARRAVAHAGLFAALLFTLMPVTICMSHEAKPHLPGAVLMLAAVWFCIRYAEAVSDQRSAVSGCPTPIRAGLSQAGPGRGRPGSDRWGTERRYWLGMCVACGAAFGMVLSALPIFVLIPLAEWMRRRAVSDQRSAVSPAGEGPRDRGTEGPIGSRGNTLRNPKSEIRNWMAVVAGIAIAFLVYLLTNPYVAINAVSNREVLLNNLRNSTAMYDLGRVGEGLLRAVELTAAGASPILLVCGVASMAVLLITTGRGAWPLIVSAAVVFAQFVLLGAGKPAEYGRFGVFVDTVLAIAAACVFVGLFERVPRALCAWPLVGLLAGVGYFGWPYMRNFHRDASPDNTREQLAARLADPHSALRPGAPGHSALCMLADPAPYNCPPLDFARIALLRYPSREAYDAAPKGPLITPDDRDGPSDSPISWANKPFTVLLPLER